MSPGAQNMKMGPDALGTTENYSNSVKHDNRTRRPSPPPKMSMGSENMKTGHDAICTTTNEPGSAKHENCSPDALDTVQNET
jgi:hypothetical protein